MSWSLTPTIGPELRQLAQTILDRHRPRGASGRRWRAAGAGGEPRQVPAGVVPGVRAGRAGDR